jgi:hypothetical protein
MTKDGFNRLTAADRIRLLLAQLDIPLDIPRTLPDLAHWAGEINQEDAADAIVCVRDNVVHPEAKLRERFRVSAHNPKKDAWSCGLWMLEMVLLSLFRYSGRYRDRREPAKPLVGVPWSKGWENL